MRTALMMLDRETAAGHLRSTTRSKLISPVRSPSLLFIEAQMKGQQHQTGPLMQLEHFLNTYPVTDLIENGKMMYVLS